MEGVAGLHRTSTDMPKHVLCRSTGEACSAQTKRYSNLVTVEFYKIFEETMRAVSTRNYILKNVFLLFIKK